MQLALQSSKYWCWKITEYRNCVRVEEFDSFTVNLNMVLTMEFRICFCYRICQLLDICFLILKYKQWLPWYRIMDDFIFFFHIIWCSPKSLQWKLTFIIIAKRYIYIKGCVCFLFPPKIKYVKFTGIFIIQPSPPKPQVHVTHYMLLKGFTCKFQAYFQKYDDWKYKYIIGSGLSLFITNHFGIQLGKLNVIQWNHRSSDDCKVNRRSQVHLIIET